MSLGVAEVLEVGGGVNDGYVRECLEELRVVDYEGALRIYEAVLGDPNLDEGVLAALGRGDRFFLLSMILRRGDMFHPWLYERCREVEAEPDGYLDLWARVHYKSTIITFGGTIQEVLNDPEITIGIFSHVKSISKAFLRQVRHEFESNGLLKRLYPDVLWSNPVREAPVWSLDDGLVVRRKGNPKEATVEACGLVDGQPTGKHYRLMIYDDVVNQGSVTTPEMIRKTTEAWELSRHLATKSMPGKPPRTWYIGTRYNLADTYRDMMERGVAVPRVYPATRDGLPDGEPVFLSQEEWDEKRRETSDYVLSCQMLQNPVAGSEQEFDVEWLRRYEVRPETLNVGIVVDPASSKRSGSSNTAMAVIGVDRAGNKYLLDGACHRMNLSERWKMLKGLREKWVRRPGVQSVSIGYERYGMQTDIEHFKEMMRVEGVSFPIKEVSWTRDTGQAKDDRIRRLIPDHQNWRFFYPYDGAKTSKMKEMERRGKGYLLAQPIKRKNESGRLYDLVEWFVSNEYIYFPATTAKDFLDAMSRIYDLDIRPPIIYNEFDVYPEYAGDY